MRRMKTIQSKEGSTLVYLIVIMAILIMIGSAIMATTFAGYMLKISEARDKTAQYIAEAGLGEAYAYLGEEIENAANYSRNIYIPAQLLNHPEVSAQPTTETAYKVAVDDYFKKGYKAYFLMNESVIRERLQTRLQLRTTSYTGANNETISGITATIISRYTETVDTLEIEFTTTVVKTNHLDQAVPATRAVKAVLQIGVPAYETPIAKQAKVIKKNALLDHALAADGNFYVSGGSVTINGNATLLGHDGIAELRSPSQSGGVIVGGNPTLWDKARNDLGKFDTGNNSGDLTVNGNLVTNKFLRIARSTLTSPSKVTLNGNVHANSIAIQGSANSNGTINIIGSASVMDDMELESPNSNVIVEGSYYGFSSGEGKIHDQSSSIIINNSDFGTTRDSSQIIVKGKGAGIDGRKFGIEFPTNRVTNTKPESPKDGTYLAGTVYADEDQTYQINASGNPTHGSVTLLENGTYLYKKLPAITGAISDTFKVDISRTGVLIDTKTVIVNLDAATHSFHGYVAESYQTGDSVSVKGNYVAYSRVLLGSNLINKDVDKEYLDLDELIHFKEFEPLLVVDKKKNLINPDVPDLMTVQDKIKYGFYSQRQEPLDLNLGNGKISLENIVYSLGNTINKNGINENAGLYALQSLTLDNLGLEFAYRVTALGDPQHPDYIGDSGSLVTGGVSSWLRPESTSEIPNIMSSNNNEFYYIQTNTNSKSVILKGEGDDALFEQLKAQLGEDNYIAMSCAPKDKGMIISNKDIYVLGKVNYEGLLVAKENIYCIGDGEKTFTNQTTSVPSNYITQLAIDGITANESVRAKKIGYWFRQEESWNEVIVDNRYIPETSVSIGSKSDFDGVIKVINWDKIGN